MPLDIQTFSIVIGGPKCDGNCPYCVSKQTGLDCVKGIADEKINWHNLAKGWRMAQNGDSTTVLLTGKGEPLLYPDEITQYLKWFYRLYASKYSRFDYTPPMPLIELQTNALRIGDLAPKMDAFPNWSKMISRRGGYIDGSGSVLARKHEVLLTNLKEWRNRGLNTIAISIAGIDQEQNSRIFRKNYPDLKTTVRFLRQLGYSVRLCVMMYRGGVDSPEKLEKAIEWCKANDVGQLTARPIRRPEETKSTKSTKWVDEHGLTPAHTDKLSAWLEKTGTQLLPLAHGAMIYDVHGQNICLADCLTNDARFNQGIRTLIFYSNGRLAYNWQHDGATILQGWPK